MKSIKRNVCVVGAGKWGKNHVRTLNGLGVLGGIVEQDSVLIESNKKLYPEIDYYSTVDESFAGDFDGYVVATPAHTHFELAKKIILAGKHLLHTDHKR